LKLEKKLYSIGNFPSKLKSFSSNHTFVAGIYWQGNEEITVLGNLTDYSAEFTLLDLTKMQEVLAVNNQSEFRTNYYCGLNHLHQRVKTEQSFFGSLRREK